MMPKKLSALLDSWLLPQSDSSMACAIVTDAGTRVDIWESRAASATTAMNFSEVEISGLADLEPPRLEGSSRRAIDAGEEDAGCWLATLGVEKEFKESEASIFASLLPAGPRNAVQQATMRLAPTIPASLIVPDFACQVC